MKILTPTEVQNLTLKSIELASGHHKHTSEDILYKIAEENADYYLYYKKKSVVVSDKKVKTEIRKDRNTLEDLYTDQISDANSSWDYRYGSNDNDCLFFLATIKFIDLLLEHCFSSDLIISQQKGTTVENQPDPTVETPIKTKQPMRPFTELLTNNYSIKDLDRLLLHLRMIDSKGNRIWPQAKKSALFGVIAALNHKKHLKEATLKELMSDLSTYLNLKDSRVKNGYSVIQKETERQALSFLNQPVKPKQ